jgi:glycine dehydrogenase subunit 1
MNRIVKIQPMTIHQYIANSSPETKHKMLQEIGITKAEDLFANIPRKIRYAKRLNLPHPTSEYEKRRHIEKLLSKNKTSTGIISHLGAGCWPHYVPALCDD